MDSYTLCFFVFLLFSANLSGCQDTERLDENHRKYDKCVRPYRCGSLDFPYPFWSSSRPRYCGSGAKDFNLACEKGLNGSEFTVMHIQRQGFRVLNINQSASTIRIVRLESEPDICPGNTTLPADVNLRINKGTTTNLTLAICNATSTSFPSSFKCKDKTSGDQMRVTSYSDKDDSLGCRKVSVPAQNDVPGKLKNGSYDLRTGLSRGFDVMYIYREDYCHNCSSSGGTCGSDKRSPEKFVCFCPQNLIAFNESVTCETAQSIVSGTMNLLFLTMGVVIFVLSAILLSCCICCLCCCYRLRKKRRRHRPSSLREAFKKPPPGVHLFSFSEIEDATDDFDPSRELGRGGCSTVYYGKLRDGREVAVKRMHENSFNRVEQFLNEIVILMRLRHENLVSLFGCASRDNGELLLVYEYVPNGTVAEALHTKISNSVVPWPVRLNIAIETANALSYLHAMDIIHRDVKTQNILLGENFHARVADFGISRVFPADATHVSTVPQGTPGYIDPDYYRYHQLTDKSDVFSFGVVMMELISSTQAVDVTRPRHAINLSDMARTKIQNGELSELVDPAFGFGLDQKVRRSVTAVAELAFQCLEVEKDSRPSMAEVFRSLKNIQG